LKIQSIDSSFDEKHFITTNPKSLSIWNFEMGKEVSMINVQDINLTKFWDKSSFMTCNYNFVQYWDTEYQNPICTLKNEKYNNFSKTGDSNILLTSTSEGELKFFDLRVGEKYILNWTIGITNNSYVSSMGYHQQQQQFAIGTNTGASILMEEKSGIILDYQKQSESKVTKIIPYGKHHFFTSTKTKQSLPSVSLWDCNTNFRLSKSYSGIDNMLDFDIQDENIYCIQSSNIYFSNTQSIEKVFENLKISTPTKLKISNFTFCKSLSLNKLLLVCTDDGKILSIKT
jgi:hypothetical protein